MKRFLITTILSVLAVCIYAQLPDTVNTGTGANTGTGDNLRVAFTKLNANDKYLYDTYSETPVTVQIAISDTIVPDAGETDYILAIGDNLAGYNLNKVELFYGNSQGNKVPTVTVWRNRGGTEAMMVSSGASFTSDAVINTSVDDLLSGDRIELRWALGTGSTAPYGMFAHLTFVKP